MKIADTNENLKLKLNLNDFNFELPVPFLPSPSDNDYRIGFIDRYVVGRVNTTSITEVSLDVYDTIVNPLYIKTEFRWKIVGPLNSKYSNKILLQEGVIDYNKKQILNLNSKIPGSKDLFTNYTQFYKPS